VQDGALVGVDVETVGNFVGAAEGDALGEEVVIVGEEVVTEGDALGDVVGLDVVGDSVGLLVIGTMQIPPDIG
jgi:hypothetical protein